jgi:hypothetical protein
MTVQIGKFVRFIRRAISILNMCIIQLVLMAIVGAIGRIRAGTRPVATSERKSRPYFKGEPMNWKLLIGLFVAAVIFIVAMEVLVVGFSALLIGGILLAILALAAYLMYKRGSDSSDDSP